MGVRALLGLSKRLAVVLLLLMVGLVACVRSQPPEATISAAPTTSPASTSLPTRPFAPTSALPTFTQIPTPTPTRQPEVNLKLVGHIGGASKALAMRGQTVYLGVGLRLVAVAASDPSAPRALAQSDSLPGVVNSVALAGDYAFVLTDASELSVLNLSHPGRLPVIGSLKLAQPAYGLAISDGYAYVAAGEAGLVIMDVSTPETPRPVGAFRTHWEAIAVTVAGHFAYVAEGKRYDVTGALEVIDVADPTAPALAGSLDLPAGWAVTVAGDYAFVATYGLRIVDVSDSSHLRLVGSYEWDTAFDDVAITSNYALLSENRYCDVVAVCPRRVSVLDVSDPAQPKTLTTLSLPHDAAGAGRGMIIQDGLIYLANEVGLQILEGPSQKIVGEYRTVSRVTDVVVANGVAYGVDGDRALHLFDVRDPATPEMASTFSEVRGSPNRIKLMDGVAVLGLWDTGFAIVDVRQLQQPRLLAQVDVGSNALIAVDGKHIYAVYTSVGGGQLSVYDIKDPGAPRLVSSLQLQRGGYAWIEIADRYALLGSEGLIEVVDISNTKSPRKAGELVLDSAEKARYPAMAVKWPYVYMIRQSAIRPFSVELLVFKFAAPTELQPMAALTLSRGGSGLAVAANYVYVVGSNGLSVVDTSDPIRPREVGVSDFGGMEIVAEGDYLYIAGGGVGLLILRASPIAPDGS